MEDEEGEHITLSFTEAGTDMYQCGECEVTVAHDLGWDGSSKICSVPPGVYRRSV